MPNAALDPQPPGAIAVLGLLVVLDLREALRRRAVRGLAVLTSLLLGLFGFAAHEAMATARRADGTITEAVVGATLLGTAAFVALLLGSVVAVFLTHSTVRGDAEQGLLAPLLARPVPRWALVLARMAAGAGAAALYALTIWIAAVVLLRIAGGWTPPDVAGPAAAIAVAVALIALIAVAASTVLPAMAAGMLTLALLGLGFTVGLVAQLGDTLSIASLASLADAASLLLPFEALYRHVLATLSEGLGELTRVGVAVGPFGGAEEADGTVLVATIAWALGVGAFAIRRATRLDL